MSSLQLQHLAFTHGVSRNGQTPGVSPAKLEDLIVIKSQPVSSLWLRAGQIACGAFGLVRSISRRKSAGRLRDLRPPVGWTPPPSDCPGATACARGKSAAWRDCPVAPWLQQDSPRREFVRRKNASLSRHADHPIPPVDRHPRQTRRS